jgi:hypothetical protein
MAISVSWVQIGRFHDDESQNYFDFKKEISRGFIIQPTADRRLQNGQSLSTTLVIS